MKNEKLKGIHGWKDKKKEKLKMYTAEQADIYRQEGNERTAVEVK